jgi:hypothetical protein
MASQPSPPLSYTVRTTATNQRICPDELMTIVVQRLAPALPGVPAELIGRPVIAVAACYAGDIDEGEEVLRPMRRFGVPVLGLFAPKPFAAHQQLFDPSFRHGRQPPA